MEFVTYMIVYKKCNARVSNFLKCKEQYNFINEFEAYDGINELDKCIKIAKDENIVITKSTVIGCTLSHIKLLKHFYENESKNWLLVFEDDLGLNNFDPDIIDNIIHISEKNNSNYIHLYVGNKHLSEQILKPQISENLYEMVPQWYTLAYLINKKGCELIFENLPCNSPIDNFYSSHIKKLNSLAYKNNMIQNLGALDALDKYSILGSINQLCALNLDIKIDDEDDDENDKTLIWHNLLKNFKIKCSFSKNNNIIKYINTNKFEILALIINLYLLFSNYRQVFQIEKYNINDKLLNEKINIIIQVKASYIIDKLKNEGIRIVVYNKETFNINILYMTFGKKYAKQLGEFYTCASDNYKKYNYQISISVHCNNTISDIYIQMCNKNKITKNITKYMKIQNDLVNIFNKYNEIKLNSVDITVKLMI